MSASGVIVVVIVAPVAATTEVHVTVASGEVIVTVAVEVMEGVVVFPKG